VVVLALAPRARAEAPRETIALLPLDADQRLEIYGQPVATEIARELVAGGIDVVVVGPNMAVPERAVLIVDGKITAGKAGAVVLAVRIRERATGATLDRLDATAPALANIDRAAAELAARVLPSVKDHLVAVHAPPATEARRIPPGSTAAPAAARTLVVHLAPADPRSAALAQALPAALTSWADRHHWHADVAAATADAQVTLSVIGYEVMPGPVPIARARVRVQIAKAFDRVVVTDSIVGDRGLAPDRLAARAAREVLEIVEPHMRRAVPEWR
jgi:hypothetical protein